MRMHLLAAAGLCLAASLAHSAGRDGNAANNEPMAQVVALAKLPNEWQILLAHQPSGAPQGAAYSQHRQTATERESTRPGLQPAIRLSREWLVMLSDISLID